MHIRIYSINILITSICFNCIDFQSADYHKLNSFIGKVKNKSEGVLCFFLEFLLDYTIVCKYYLVLIYLSVISVF